MSKFPKWTSPRWSISQSLHEKRKCIMNLPLLSDNTFLLRSLDLILKGLKIKPKASHMQRKSFTTERQLLSKVFWTGPQRENSAKLTKTVQSPEKGSKSMYQIY